MIKVKEVPIKAHNSVKKVKLYHIPLRYIYKIISLKLKGISCNRTSLVTVKISQ